MDGVSLGQVLNNVGVVSGSIVLVAMFVSDKIVSGKRLRKAEADLLRWQNVALEALAAARVVVPAAEVMHNLVTRLPDPGPDPADNTDTEAEVTP